MDDTTQLVLRELDNIKTTIDRQGKTLGKSIDKLEETIAGHNGRLRLVEVFIERSRGAKEAVGWRAPLFTAIGSGLTVGVVLKLIG